MSVIDHSTMRLAKPEKIASIIGGIRVIESYELDQLSDAVIGELYSSFHSAVELMNHENGVRQHQPSSFSDEFVLHYREYCILQLRRFRDEFEKRQKTVKEEKFWEAIPDPRDPENRRFQYKDMDGIADAISALGQKDFLKLTTTYHATDIAVYHPAVQAVLTQVKDMIKEEGFNRIAAAKESCLAAS